MRKLWTDEERKKLAEIYPHNTTKYCAEKLGRTTSAVSGQANKMGLKKSEHHLKHGSGRIKKAGVLASRLSLKKVKRLGIKVYHTCQKTALHVSKKEIDLILGGLLAQSESIKRGVWCARFPIRA